MNISPHLIIISLRINVLDANITAKTSVDDSHLNEMIKPLATKEEKKTLVTKAELQAEQDKTVKLQTNYLSLFIGQTSFKRSKLSVILQPLYYTLKRLDNTENVVLRKSKGLSTEKLTTTTTTNNSLSPSVKWYKDSNFCLMFKGSCLKQKNGIFTLPNRIFVYKLDTWSRDLNSDFTLKYCLFGGVKLAKNDDLDDCIYIGYSIGFDLRSKFSLPDGSVGKNIMFRS